ncbi:hypothetical protein IWT140_01945 [Secundilactobacillus pentosiphilus]|uniref:Uncharacterized protein n=1 Tax=Secundilactobacillus pentosiphilus TaxID=1714682 RepID=A0A1Z5IRC5_9LACO|nr:hypothetical protein [Secundilactobacillus pentosiphilus]GAX04307.1 hypothetical protein IWT140_01945 [Secundilactobacillus pentosiphilus]
MTNKLLEIYLVDDDKSFIVGTIIAENPNQLLIVAIDDNGQVDSVEIVFRSHIAKIVSDSRYLTFCQAMIKENQTIGIFDAFKLAEQLPGSWQSLDQFLAECQDEQRLISVITAPEIYTGRVSMVSQHQLGLQLMDFESVSFGAPTLIDRADIMVIDYVSRQNNYVTKYWKTKGRQN